MATSPRAMHKYALEPDDGCRTRSGECLLNCLPFSVEGILRACAVCANKIIYAIFVGFAGLIVLVGGMSYVSFIGSSYTTFAGVGDMGHPLSSGEQKVTLGTSLWS